MYVCACACMHTCTITYKQEEDYFGSGKGPRNREVWEENMTR